MEVSVANEGPLDQDRSIEGITFVELGGVEERVNGHSTLS